MHALLIRVISPYDKLTIRKEKEYEMITFLTSSIGGSYKKDGKRYPTLLLSTNGFNDQLKKYWKEYANVLVISASPEEWERNDSIHNILKIAFPMSGLSINLFEICDSRSVGLADQINRFDVVILAGGHVPTQNKFFEQLGLKKLLEDYDGFIDSLECRHNELCRSGICITGIGWRRY